MDVCDDVEYSQEMKVRSGEAKAAGIPAVSSCHLDEC